METLFNNEQFFIVFLSIIWIFFIIMYFDTKKKLFIYGQLLVSFPLSIIISSLSFIQSLLYGWLVVFVILILSFSLTGISLYEKDKK